MGILYETSSKNSFAKLLSDCYILGWILKKNFYVHFPHLLTDLVEIRCSFPCKVINPLAPYYIYIYMYIHMSYLTANLQALHFKYLLNKYTY